MTRKEFEEIKECCGHLNRELDTLRDKPIERNRKQTIVVMLDKLIHALENGSIEEEPVLCIKCGVPLTLANYEDWNGNMCNACRKPDENDEPELIPCPFCPAGTSALTFMESADGLQGRYICKLLNIGCGAKSGYCSVGDPATLKQRAADIWNTRAPTPTELTKLSETGTSTLISVNRIKDVKEAIFNLVSEFTIIGGSITLHTIGGLDGTLLKMRVKGIYDYNDKFTENGGNQYYMGDRAIRED